MTARWTDLAGKSVLVTGASSGIGRAAALAFARRGCRISAAARSRDKLEALSARLRAAGAECDVTPVDVRDRWQAREAVEAAVRRWGRLDVLVNNAGILETGPFESQPLDSLEDIVRTNFLGAAYVLHAALPHMRARGDGHVVNVASIAGLMGMPLMSAYCASKFALVGLTESLRRELSGTGVTLTAFCPGSTDTPMVEAILKDPRLPRLVRPKSAADMAERIVEAALRRSPQVVFGEVPGILVGIARMFPSWTDRAVWEILRRVHPLVADWSAARGSSKAPAPVPPGA